ncbi:MAG: hypothetical protein EBR88_06525 [Betaproteobacteria bacterium]|nr:hypothetical protein [Betaproteobacteria bacterium]
MRSTIFSSRAFNQHINEAKRATEDGLVFVTNRGKPQHVLLKMHLWLHTIMQYLEAGLPRYPFQHQIFPLL